jgi:hypothetical protein
MKRIAATEDPEDAVEGTSVLCSFADEITENLVNLTFATSAQCLPASNVALGGPPRSGYQCGSPEIHAAAAKHRRIAMEKMTGTQKK